MLFDRSRRAINKNQVAKVKTRMRCASPAPVSRAAAAPPARNTGIMISASTDTPPVRSVCTTFHRVLSSCDETRLVPMTRLRKANGPIHRSGTVPGKGLRSTFQINREGCGY